MADTLVLGTSAHACRFKSCRPHQNNRYNPKGCVCYFLYQGQGLNLGKVEASIKQSGGLFLASSAEAPAVASSMQGIAAADGKSCRPHQKEKSLKRLFLLFFSLFFFHFSLFSKTRLRILRIKDKREKKKKRLLCFAKY